MNFQIGTEIYYTGDMANVSGHFRVAGQAMGNVILDEVGGFRRFKVYPTEIGHVYQGHCSPRFVTEVARQAFIRERLPTIEAK